MGMVRAGARHSEPQTHVDEQPAGSVPGGCDELVPGPLASDVCSCPSAAPKLGDTIADHHVNENGMLMHDFSSRQELL